VPARQVPALLVGSAPQEPPPAPLLTCGPGFVAAALPAAATIAVVTHPWFDPAASTSSASTCDRKVQHEQCQPTHTTLT
jgi:hypothetical protein